MRTIEKVGMPAVILAGVALLGCAERDVDNSQEVRDAEIAVEDYGEEVAAFEDELQACADEAQDCLLAAADEADAVACKDAFEECIPDIPDVPDLPDIPDVPDLPDLPDLPDDVDGIIGDCLGDAQMCIDGAVALTDIGDCASILAECSNDGVDDVLDDSCTQATEACEASGAPAAVCDAIADSGLCG